MIGSPFYRLLVAAGLMLSAAVATARVGPDAKAPCDDRRSSQACAIPHAPEFTAAPRRVDDRGAAVAVANPS